MESQVETKRTHFLSDVFAAVAVVVSYKGNSSKDDGDGNENGKKAKQHS